MFERLANMRKEQISLLGRSASPFSFFYLLPRKRGKLCWDGFRGLDHDACQGGVRLDPGVLQLGCEILAKVVLQGPQEGFRYGLVMFSGNAVTGMALPERAHSWQDRIEILQTA